MSVTVSNHGWVQRFFMLFLEITLCWQKKHVWQYVYIMFVIPHHGCQITAHPSLYITPILFSNILNHHFSIWPNSLMAVYCLSK